MLVSLEDLSHDLKGHRDDFGHLMDDPLLDECIHHFIALVKLHEDKEGFGGPRNGGGAAVEAGLDDRDACLGPHAAINDEWLIW